MPVHPRHPYAGDLVYTAFSGSHQDAIKKGMTALPVGYGRWEVPYLPIDPKHTGRTYEAIIRVNSQSGKGGVAYIMGTEHGLDLPRRLQVEFSRAVQAVTEASGTEIKPSEIWEVFEKTYLAQDAALRLVGAEVTTERTGEAHTTKVVAQLLVEGEHHSAVGQGNGPIDAFVNALRQFGVELSVLDYHQHALTAGSGASSVAYVEAGAGGRRCVGGRPGLEHPRRLPASRHQCRQPAPGAVQHRSRLDAWRTSPMLSACPVSSQKPPVRPAAIRVVYLGPVAPHWRVDSDFGDRNLIEELRQRILARLLLLPPHDPQFRRNRERIVRDTKRENVLLQWDLGVPEDDDDFIATTEG